MELISDFCVLPGELWSCKVVGK